MGPALGAGFGMIMTVDMVVASEDAFFARPQSRIGFAGFDVQLPLTLMRCGINRGYEMNITGRRVSAQELQKWGRGNVGRAAGAARGRGDGGTPRPSPRTAPTP